MEPLHWLILFIVNAVIWTPLAWTYRTRDFTWQGAFAVGWMGFSWGLTISTIAWMLGGV